MQQNNFEFDGGSQPAQRSPATKASAKAVKLPIQVRLQRLREEHTQIPIWIEDQLAISNHLVRCQLFSLWSRRSGRETFYRTELASRSDTKIFYTGVQLDMSDCDVFMHLVQAAKNALPGTLIKVDEWKLLKELGRAEGGSNYEQLRDSIRRIFYGSIEIEVSGKFKIGTKAAGVHLIDKYEYNEETKEYSYIVDPSIVMLFENDEYSLIDWEIRKRFSVRVEMCKWMQNYISSHKPGSQFVSASNLRSWMGYKSPMRKFITALDEVLTELKKYNIISEYTITDDAKTLVKWFRPTRTESNKRLLQS